MAEISQQSGGCCKCCFSFIFTSGLTALFLWLSLRPSGPKCSLQNIYLPALNKTLNSTKNNTLFFDLKLQNTNKDKGVYYDLINVTFYDSPSKTHLIATGTIQHFYQGHQKKATKHGNTTTIQIDRAKIFRDNGTVFRVDMVTFVRYKIMAWTTKRHIIMVGADVPINDQGTKNVSNPKKGIRLKSGAAMNGVYCGQKGIVLVSFLIWVLLNCFEY